MEPQQVVGAEASDNNPMGPTVVEVASMTDIAPVTNGPTPCAHDRPDPSPVASRSGVRPAVRPSDRVELSDRARYLGKLADLPVRRELVDQVRREIADGTYDSLDRVEAAIQSLSEDLELGR